VKNQIKYKKKKK